ncbi:zonadhesin-like [Lingula anatina]|uniref:Zonadhesin-like n=1 Tax=Lingula anatina TaxID=7574 RepID=A0A1S3JVW0_LINAN|nr:zonadhesin-like [Lingula anatina]|eukprot:XP_013414528.1 zonadhesin-like [Lingula anatina]
MRYSPETTRCPASCDRSPRSERCERGIQEGCECLAGYVRSGHLCVPNEMCGCMDAMGSYHQLSDSWASGNCSHWYTCVEPNQIEETGSPCGVESKCLLEEGVWECSASNEIPII